MVHFRESDSMMMASSCDHLPKQSQSKTELIQTTISQTYIYFPPLFFFFLIYLLSLDPLPLFIPFYIPHYFIFLRLLKCRKTPKSMFCLIKLFC